MCEDDACLATVPFPLSQSSTVGGPPVSTLVHAAFAAPFALGEHAMFPGGGVDECECCARIIVSELYPEEHPTLMLYYYRPQGTARRRR